MTIIQKLINKLKSLLKIGNNDQELTTRKVQDEAQQVTPQQTLASREPNNTSYYYTPKSRGNALEFQDSVNNELFWDNN